MGRQAEHHKKKQLKPKEEKRSRQCTDVVKAKQKLAVSISLKVQLTMTIRIPRDVYMNASVCTLMQLVLRLKANDTRRYSITCTLVKLPCKGVAKGVTGPRLIPMLACKNSQKF